MYTICIMEIIILSFIAGILTILSPCVFTLLPVILGGTLKSGEKRSPVLIILSMSISILLFTLLLKVSTLFLNVDSQIWRSVSGGLITMLGIFTIFPLLWGNLSYRFGFDTSSEKLLQKAGGVKGRVSDILVGGALGPVFSSCSPTYSLIIATILPLNLLNGLFSLVVYIFGLALVLYIISILGNRFIEKLKWAVNPNGWFKRIIGALFIVIGVLVFFGLDKKMEVFLIERGIYKPVNLEIELIDNVIEKL